MTTTISELLSSIVQIVLFTIIPFIWWLITARKKESFFSWLGLKKPDGNRREIILFLIIAFIICEISGLIIYNSFLKTEWNHSAYAGMGAKGIPAMLLYCYAHTAFSEEILFRGFLQKRLQKQFGFVAGTIIQATLFGAAHVVLALGSITVLQGVLLFVYPMIPAVFIAVLNEKKSNGSILPGWLLHGTLNLFSHLAQM